MNNDAINGRLEPTNKFQIRCTECDETICAASSLDKLFAQFLDNANMHNYDDMDMELCSDAKEELSLDNLRSSFSSGNFQIEMATWFEVEASQHEPVKELFSLDTTYLK